MTDTNKIITNFQDRLNKQNEYVHEDPRVMAEQRLAIRCICFKSTAEIKAYIEALGCSYLEYTDIKRRYRVLANTFKKLPKAKQRELLLSANINPKVALYEKSYE